MRRGRIFFYLAFIIILGLVAVVVVFQRFMKPPAPTSAAEPSAAPATEVVNVVVVTQQVPRGNVLDEAVLGVVPVPKALFIQGMYNDMNEVAGRQVKFDLDSGVFVTNSMLVEEGEQLSSTGSNAALSVPRGMVAVSIPISRLASVSYAPQGGDHVNVMATMLFVDMDTEFQSVLPNNTMGVIGPGVGTGTLSGSNGTNTSSTDGAGAPNSQGQTGAQIETSSLAAVSGGGGGTQGRAEVDPVFGQTFYLVPSEKQRPRLVSQSLLQDVVVLRMGDFSLPGDEPTATEVPASDPAAAQTAEEEAATDPDQNPDVVTLIVTPQDAVTLNYLVYSGAQLNLALRSAGDDSRIETEAVTLQFLLDQYRIPLPVKLPYGMEPRIDQLVPPVLLNDVVVTPEP